MVELTFNDLPQAVTQLYHKLENLERILLEKSPDQSSEIDRWFDLNELCNYLPDRPAKATVYGWVHTLNIPHHKGQKKLRFLKSEIDQWLMKGKRKTNSEIAIEAEQNLIKIKA